MKSQAIIAALTLALVAAPIFAQEAATSEQATAAQQAPAQSVPAAAAPVADAATAAPDPGEEIICRRDRATGSLTRVNRVCKTRNEWNGIHANTRDNMNDMQRNASGGAACRGDQFGGC